MNIQNIRSRSQIIKLIRAWFDERGYAEMHTPRLVGLPGQEPHLEPMWTSVSVGAQLIAPSGAMNRAPTVPAALITSPEYAMKRLLAEGMEKIYDLGPCFRNNEPWDGTHDPEFLMLEWYRKSANLSDLMDDTEDLVMSVAREFRSSPSSLARSWRRITVEQTFRDYLNVELTSLLGDVEGMKKLAISLDQTVTAEDSWDDVFFKIFLSHIEPKLGIDQPTFLHRYPISMAALARPCQDDPRFADRVELYIGGLELANGFAELADADEQRKRFEEEQSLRQKLGKKTWPIDEKFLEALPKMGNAVGIAFGVDRFVMLLTGAKSINDVVPFSARERFV
jgi:lysyl-tRNA synthetase class 2